MKRRTPKKPRDSLTKFHKRKSERAGKKGHGQGSPLKMHTDEWEADLSNKQVTPERFYSALEFIRACRKVGVRRLKEGELTGKTGLYLGDVARELAASLHALIREGDVALARRLPPVVEVLQSAMEAFGTKITARVTKDLSIERILRKHSARELLEMLAALYPDWDAIHHIENKRAIEALSEQKLRALLLNKECWILERDGKRTEQWRKHRLAETIENIIAVREGEGANVNLFVEQLRRGWLWCGPGRTFEKCPWQGRKDLPARGDVRAWMKIVMPFLKEVTGDDAMRLHVFEHMMAGRKPVFAGSRLADDKPEYIWNQVENRIRKAWVTMAKRADKRNSGKTA